MKKATVVMIVHNALDKIQICVRTLKMFVNEETVKIIIADNGSSDGLKEWVEAQAGVDYHCTSNEMRGYAATLNTVIKSGSLVGDILFMTPHYLFTPHCIERLQNTLRDKETGIAVPVSNGFSGNYDNQKPMKEIENFEQAVQMADEIEEVILQYRAGVCPEVIMIKEDMLKHLGYFDENMVQIDNTITDYLLRVINQGYDIRCCLGAVMYDIGYDTTMQAYRNLAGADKDKSYLEKKWGMHYFNGRCNEGLLLLMNSEKEHPIKVLEIGCDCGANLLGIKNRFPNSDLYGLEINENAANIARHLVKNVEVGNIEDERLPFLEETFDYIIFGDVLEHLHNPEQTLKYCRRFLKKEGCVIASVPNLMHISVMQELMAGNFTYKDSGLLDSTHIHMFTYNEIIKMLIRAGYSVEDIGGTTQSITEKQEELLEGLLALSTEAERFMFDIYQYLVRAKKK